MTADVPPWGLPAAIAGLICAGGAGPLVEGPGGELSSPPLPGFSCAVDAAQSVWCWGANDRGQLGDGTRIDRSRAVRVLLPDLPARALACGGAHACAALDDEGLYCWGANDHGQLGHPSSLLPESLEPVLVPLPSLR